VERARPAHRLGAEQSLLRPVMNRRQRPPGETSDTSDIATQGHRQGATSLR
jgi:hypothetical protein